MKANCPAALKHSDSRAILTSEGDGGPGPGLVQLGHGQAKVQDKLDSFGVNTLKDSKDSGVIATVHYCTLHCTLYCTLYCTLHYTGRGTVAA